MEAVCVKHRQQHKEDWALGEMWHVAYVLYALRFGGESSNQEIRPRALEYVTACIKLLLRFSP